MSALFRLAALLAPLALAACAQGPFVDATREEVLEGEFTICYDSRATTPAEVVALAERTCGRENKYAHFRGQQPFQCRLTAATRAYYTCRDTPQQAGR